jgi:hypothetical protein
LSSTKTTVRKAKEKFIIESEHINPYPGCRVWKEFPMAQAHAISRDIGIKLNTQKEKVKIFDKKKVLKEVEEKRYQKEIHWQQHMDERIETL